MRRRTDGVVGGFRKVDDTVSVQVDAQFFNVARHELTDAERSGKTPLHRRRIGFSLPHERKKTFQLVLKKRRAPGVVKREGAEGIERADVSRESSVIGFDADDGGHDLRRYLIAFPAFREGRGMLPNKDLSVGDAGRVDVGAAVLEPIFWGRGGGKRRTTHDFDGRRVGAGKRQCLNDPAEGNAAFFRNLSGPETDVVAPGVIDESRGIGRSVGDAGGREQPARGRTGQQPAAGKVGAGVGSYHGCVRVRSCRTS